MASSTGSDNSASIEKSSSKDKNKTGVDEEHTSSPNPTPPLASERVFTGGTRFGFNSNTILNPTKNVAVRRGKTRPLSNSSGVVTTPHELWVMPKRLCDVFGDGSDTSSVKGFTPHKQPIKMVNAAYNEKDQVPTREESHPRRHPLIGNRMDSYPNSLYSGIQLTVDLPIHGPQLHPPLVSNRDGSIDDQAPKGEPKDVLEDKQKKEAAQEREVVAAKSQKEAQVGENVWVMAKYLRNVFGGRSRASSRKRLCDVFGDGSGKSSVGGLVPHKPPIRMVNATYNEKDQVPAGKDTYPRQPLIGNKMHSYPNSLYSRFPGIQLIVDLPIDGPQLHPPVVSNKDGSTDDQAQKGKPEKILEDKPKREAARGREVVAAKRQKEAQVGENVQVMDKRLHDVFGDGSHTSSVGGLIPHKHPIRMVNATYNEKDQVHAEKDTHPRQALCGNRMHSYPNSLYSKFPGMQLTIDLPIHGPQLHPPLVSNKNGSIDDQAPKGKPNKVLEVKQEKEAAQRRENATAKPQKEAQVGENAWVMDKQLCDVFGDGSHASSVGGLIPHTRPIRMVNATYNKKDQVHAGKDTHPRQPKPKKVLKDKRKKEAAQGREATAAKPQKEAQVGENVRVLAKLLRDVFGDRSRTSSRKRLCDVFGDGSIPHKRPIRKVNATYNEKDQVPTEKDTYPRQPLCWDRMHSYQNSYYSRLPRIQLIVDLPISSPMATTTQGREVVAEEQQARSAIRDDDVVPVVKYHCPDLNLLSPEEDDEDLS